MLTNFFTSFITAGMLVLLIAVALLCAVLCGGPGDIARHPIAVTLGIFSGTVLGVGLLVAILMWTGR